VNNNIEKVASKDSKSPFSDLIMSVETNVKELDRYILQLTPNSAHKILNDPVTSQEFVRIMIELQALQGIVLGMHPESLYSSEYKTKERTIFEKAIEISEVNSRFIEVALEVYQSLKASIVDFTSNPINSYNLIIKIIPGTRWSFYGIVLQVLNNCKKLVTYLKHLPNFEAKKGELTYTRRLGEITEGVKVDELMTKYVKKEFEK